MSLPVSASVPDLAMTIPTGFAAALGIWFATTTAILFAEAGLARRIAKFRLLEPWQALPVAEVRAALPLEQQCVTTRQKSVGRAAYQQPASRIANQPYSSANCGVCFWARRDASHAGPDDQRLLAQHHGPVYPAG